MKLRVILDEQKGSGFKTNKQTDSGYDVRAIGYSRITPVFERIYGTDVQVDGKIEAPVYFAEAKEEFVIIMPGDSLLLKTGVKVELPEGVYSDEGIASLLEIQCRPRSGFSLKMGMNVHLGTIDNEYRGDIGVIVTNVNKYPIKITMGERVGQLVFNEIIKFDEENFEYVEKFEFETSRGEAGYGSSGK